MTFRCRNHELFRRFFVVLICLNAVNLHANVSHADGSSQDNSSAMSALTAFQAATGGAAWDSVQTLTTICTIKQGGLSGVDHNWEDVTTGLYADRYTIGGVSGADGFDGSKSWIADSGGIARYRDSEDDLRSAFTNSWLVSMAYWYPNRRSSSAAGVRQVEDENKNYTVVTANPSGGCAVDLWFDPGTHYLVRTVMVTARQTITTTFSDYRQVSGVTVPFTTVVSTGDSRYELTISVISELVNQPVPMSTFALPAPVAPDYTMPASTDSVTVPFVYAFGHIYVPVIIDGHGPYAAILDTGARLAFTPALAHEIHVDITGKLAGSGAGQDTVREGIARVATVAIGGMTIDNLTATVLQMPTPADNPLIGAELFNRFAVQVDFDKDRLTLTPLGSFSYTGAATAIPFRFHGDIPEVDGNLDGLTGGYMIDTGSSNSLDLFGPFVSSHGLLARYRPPFTANGGFGVGGPEIVSVARAGSFSIGSAAMLSPLIYISNAAQGSFSDTAVAGNVGMGFLHRFNLTFDYARQLIYFDPNSLSTDPDAYERLGIAVDAGPGGCAVVDVIAGSPAADAGIAAGDVITSVNGKALGALDGGWLVEETFLPTGTKLDLVVKHGRKSRDVSVILRDLI